MLPVAIVKWTRQELTAQAKDETWFKLSVLADVRRLETISQRIRTALAQPNTERGQRRITFLGPEAAVVMNIIENE